MSAGARIAALALALGLALGGGALLGGAVGPEPDDDTPPAGGAPQPSEPATPHAGEPAGGKG